KVLCTPSWREEKQLLHWKKERLDRYCDIDSPLHYFVTDSALAQARNECTSCEYLLVTNADNYYYPGFLSKASKLLIRDQADIVLTDFLHRGEPMVAKVVNGHMDLGCVLTRFSIFTDAQQLDFTSLLPENAEPQDWHDADFWMVVSLQRRHNRTVTFLKEMLFIHN
ncbi:unnamed protein product, partial [Ectocarpus fasciculatus]